MRTTLTLTLLLLSAVPPAHARCAPSAHWAWPPPGELPANGLFVLDGYGQSQHIVEELAPGDADLECAGRSVALEPISVLRGEMRVSQATLQAKQALPAGATCQLRVRQLGGSLGTWTGDGKVPYEWSISAAEDLNPPVWTDPPSLVERRYIRYGCGPVVEVDFTYPVADEGPTLALVEVASVTATDAVTSYLVPPREGKISVGHGMCSGPFRLRPGARYLLWLTAMDTAGNLSPRVGPIPFAAPEP